MHPTSGCAVTTSVSVTDAAIYHDAEIMQLDFVDCRCPTVAAWKNEVQERAYRFGDTVPSYGFMLTRIFATWRRRCSAWWSSAVNMQCCTLDATKGTCTKRSYLGTGRYLISQPKI
jgi:hypothetical protein